MTLRSGRAASGPDTARDCDGATERKGERDAYEKDLFPRRLWIAKPAWEGEKEQGWVVVFFKKKKKSLEWICTSVEDNWGFLLFVLGIETKKWRL